MEPFRSLVDRKVIDIINDYNEKELTTEVKSELLKILTETVYFDSKKSPLMVGLTQE